MKILLDECLPRKLKGELPGHEVHTVPEMGWASKKNGELLNLMAGQFDVFVTIDGNMQYQHDLEAVRLSFVVLTAHNNKFGTLQPLMVKVLEILQTIRAGDVIEVSASDP